LISVNSLITTKCFSISSLNILLSSFNSLLSCLLSKFYFYSWFS